LIFVPVSNVYVLRLLAGALWLSWFPLLAGPVCALTLYFTEFEEFTAGPDQWAGAQGWQGSSVGLGVHGIDQDIIPALGKTAYLGFNRPDSTFVTVFRPVLYDPATNGVPVVEFESLMGIEDSTNSFRDSFFFTFYNNGGDVLAAIRFDNDDLTFGIWRFDGVQEFDTGWDFVRSELHLLVATMDLSNNVWTAELDGVPLFTNAVFNASGQTGTLGFVAAEWQLTSASTNNHGNNWMLVADWAVRAVPDQDAPFSIMEAGLDLDGSPLFVWPGSFGFDYEVEYSDDLDTWQSGLPDGVFENILEDAPLTFTGDAESSNRSYRIHRSPTP